MPRKAPLSHTISILAFLMALCGALAGASGPAAAADEIPRMEPIDLYSLIYYHKPVVVLDVRSTQGWRGSSEMIQGAIYHPPLQAENWATGMDKNLTYVLYCACPEEHSAVGTAQQMQTMGFRKVYALKGGWAAWKLGGYPTQARK